MHRYEGFVLLYETKIKSVCKNYVLHLKANIPVQMNLMKK